MRASRFIANFDSSTAHLRALGRFLHGRDFPWLAAARWITPELIGDAVSALPGGVRRWAYASSGALEAVTPRQLAHFRAEDFARWAVRRYPREQVPSVFIGSPSGAQVHLCAALGVPWLPQTQLIPVAPHLHPDGPREALEYGREIALPLLDRNPELVLHHVHDPAQDRRMLMRTTSFRVKRTRLGETYAEFIRSVLPPGGTIFVSECRRAWPVTRVGPRHVFQMGALGARVEDEGLENEPADIDERNAPPATELAPEAEWGFDEELLPDIEEFARAHDYRVCRVLFDEPDDLSPLVAELYGWWYRLRRLSPSRLVVESFVQLDPYWVLRTGSVPFWMKFNMEEDADRLEAYLDVSGPWDSLHLMLFQHGQDADGLTPIARWRELLARARRSGDFLGVDPEKHPRDFSAFLRYHRALRELSPRYAMPGPLSLELLERFLAEHGARFPVKWIEHSTSARGAAPVEP